MAKKKKNEVACIVMDLCAKYYPKEGFLKEVKKIAKKNKILLIFDEIITGFRLHPGGAQKYFGVTPDLSCFGKGLANGFPLSALVGKKRYMYEHSHVYITKTFYEQSSGVTIEDKMINLTAFRNRITNIFKKYTKLPDEIYKILFKREIFFNAEECLKYGIIDEII